MGAGQEVVEGSSSVRSYRSSLQCSGSVASSVSEEKQTVGAHTTEEASGPGGAARSLSSPSPALAAPPRSGESSSSGAPPPSAPKPGPRGEGGFVAGTALMLFD
jgi:hypothetical protein